MVLAAAAVAADGCWSAFVRCTGCNKRLCCRDEGPRCAPGDPSRRWPDVAVAPTVIDSAASISFCGTHQTLTL